MASELGGKETKMHDGSGIGKPGKSGTIDPTTLQPKGKSMKKKAAQEAIDLLELANEQDAKGKEDEAMLLEKLAMEKMAEDKEEEEETEEEETEKTAGKHKPDCGCGFCKRIRERKGKGNVEKSQEDEKECGN